MPWRLYMQYGDAFFSSGAKLWMAVAAMFLVAGVVKGAIGLGLPTISTALLALWMPPIKAAALLGSFGPDIEWIASSLEAAPVVHERTPIQR
jgi:hypothetical protein